MDTPSPEHETDLRLVQAVLGGEGTAREEFAARMRITSRILASRNARMGHPLGEAELEDLVQDTLLSVWRKLPTYEGRAALETWVYRFCFLELMNALRRKGRAPLALEDLGEDLGKDPWKGVGGEAQPAYPEEQGIGRYLRHLAAREAQVLRLRHVEELGFREIGAALGISASSAKTHYYRALQKLRSLVREEAR